MPLVLVFLITDQHKTLTKRVDLLSADLLAYLFAVDSSLIYNNDVKIFFKVVWELVRWRIYFRLLVT